MLPRFNSQAREEPDPLAEILILNISLKKKNFQQSPLIYLTPISELRSQVAGRLTEERKQKERRDQMAPEVKQTSKEHWFVQKRFLHGTCSFTT